MAFVLTQPFLVSPDNIHGDVYSGITIDPGDTAIVGSVLLTDAIAVKWIYSIKDNTGTNFNSGSGEVMSHYSGVSPSPTHNRYSVIGNIPHQIDVVISGSVPMLELHIKNNSGYQIIASSTRIDVVA